MRFYSNFHIDQILQIHKVILESASCLHLADVYLYFFTDLLLDQRLDLFFVIRRRNCTGTQFIRQHDQKPVAFSGT